MMTKLDVGTESKAGSYNDVSEMLRHHLTTGIANTKKRLGGIAALTQVTAVGMASTTKKIVYNLLTTVLTLLLVFSFSLFMYTTFYYVYMPKEIHEVDVNFQFESCPDTMGMCSYPNASVHLSQGNAGHMLMTGQSYSFNMLLEVPDCPINQDQGMFMSCLHVRTKDNHMIGETCKSNILEYRSNLLRVIETFVFAPFLLAGSTTQRQWININYFKEFMDDPHNPATNIDIEIRSKFFQVYSASLQVHAELTGLRHIMYHHPWISTVAGVSANMFIISVIILISWSRIFLMPSDGELQQDEDKSGLEGELQLHQHQEISRGEVQVDHGLVDEE